MRVDATGNISTIFITSVLLYAAPSSNGLVDLIVCSFTIPRVESRIGCRRLRLWSINQHTTWQRYCLTCYESLSSPQRRQGFGQIRNGIRQSGLDSVLIS